MDFLQDPVGTKAGPLRTELKSALQRILVDPEFVYRQEAEPAGVAPGKSYRISDLALASRLSFFLWSSIPDDELIELASQGKLRDPEPYSKNRSCACLRIRNPNRVTVNFTGQWLGVRSLENQRTGCENFVPDFDDNLRAAYQAEEIELFFDKHRAGGSQRCIDLLTANYTYVNERLAKQYGIPNIYGSRIPTRAAAGGIRRETRIARKGGPGDC